MIPITEAPQFTKKSLLSRNRSPRRWRPRGRCQVLRNEEDLSDADSEHVAAAQATDADGPVNRPRRSTRLQAQT